MAIPTAPPSLVPTTNIFWDHFARAETNTFRRRYDTVLVPYYINPAETSAATASVDVAWLIYSADQEGVPTLFP